MTMSEELLKFEFEQILYLQDKLQGMEPFLELVSRQFTPTRMYYIFGPLICSLTGDSLVETIVAMSFADYVALLMKWVVRENRPFWWIHETEVYTSIDRPALQQHPLTCETTAGGPSSHSVIMTVFLYMQGRWLINYLHMKKDWNKENCQLGVFSAIAAITIAMWVSRMYFGCHFLHQCVAGTTLALSIVGCIEQEEIRKEFLNADKKRAVGIALGMLFTAGVIYGGMIMSGIDPQWSVRMAFKWCQNIEYLHPESTPMYGMVKSLGSIFGLAFCAPLNNKLAPSTSRWKSVPTTIGFIVMNHVLLLKAPKDHGCCMFLFYVFGAAALNTYSMLTLVPRVCNSEQ